ncbi:MAG: roadblock/LC7 domain-containing protein [Actinobacteria bacterium]|nr:roadblock/LC7 domain-containing protein [Actinomycetota bacterium]
MRRILKGLNEIVGIRGSMVVSEDGMVISSCLGRSLDEEKVAAMASNVINNTHKALELHGLEKFSRFTLKSSHGKMVFLDCGIAYLVVVMDQRIELGPGEIELTSAGRRIRNMGEMRIG